MKSRIQFVSGLVIAAVFAGMVMAEGDAPKKPAAPKAKSYKGTLAAKPAEAAADILAVLTVKDKEGKETAYNVMATDEKVIAGIKDLLAKGGNVVIKGTASEDGKSITAVSATADVPKEKAPAKPKAEKKGGEGAPAME